MTPTATPANLLCPSSSSSSSVAVTTADGENTLHLLDNNLLGSLFESLPSATILVFSSTAQGKVLPSVKWSVLINNRGRQVLRLDSLPCPATDISHPLYFHELPLALKPLIPILKNHSQAARREEVRLKLPVADATPTTLVQTERCIIGYNYTALEPLDKHSPDHTSGVWAFMFTDITQLVQDRLAFDRLQQELYQSKKLASLGTMISGVAHELNNPLAGISMRAELSKMAVKRIQQTLGASERLPPTETLLPLCHQLADGLAQITENCNKASVLVSDLMDYSRNSDLVLTPHPLIPLLQKMVQALKSHSDFASIPLLLTVSPQLADKGYCDYVRCEPVRLEQVFYNLVKNARDALLAHPVLDKHPQISVTLAPGSANPQTLCVSVEDNGPGIDPEVLGRIFDPFFSTKGAKGLGLGLSISYRTVEQHGGTMSVTSKPGEGTRFEVVLPLAGNAEPSDTVPALKDLP